MTTLYTCELCFCVGGGRGGGSACFDLLQPYCFLCGTRLADNLPAATVFRNLKTNELQYEDGFKLGFVFEQNVFLNNHLNLVIKYHPVQRLGV